MKRLNKKTGIAIFTAVMAILAVIILVYHNPLANPQDELLKKVIACVLIVAAVIAFIRLYDKITVLPVENLSMMREINIAYHDGFTQFDVLHDIMQIYNETLRIYT